MSDRDFDALYDRMVRNSVPAKATRQDQIRATWGAMTSYPPRWPWRVHLLETLPLPTLKAVVDEMSTVATSATFDRRREYGPGWTAEEVFCEDVILERKTYRGR